VIRVHGHQIFAMGYGPDGATAGAVWESVRDDNLAYLSVWRIRHRSQWYIVVCADPEIDDARALIDFRGGVEVPMNEDDALRFLEKRRTFSFEGISGGEKDMWEVVRYGRRGYYMRGDE